MVTGISNASATVHLVITDLCIYTLGGGGGIHVKTDIADVIAFFTRSIAYCNSQLKPDLWSHKAGLLDV